MVLRPAMINLFVYRHVAHCFKIGMVLLSKCYFYAYFCMHLLSSIVKVYRKVYREAQNGVRMISQGDISKLLVLYR